MMSYLRTVLGCIEGIIVISNNLATPLEEFAHVSRFDMLSVGSFTTYASLMSIDP